MSRITLPTPEQVPADSKPTLDAFTKNIGFTPNMMAAFALSPIAFNSWAAFFGFDYRSPTHACTMHRFEPNTLSCISPFCRNVCVCAERTTLDALRSCLQVLIERTDSAPEVASRVEALVLEHWDALLNGAFTVRWWCGSCNCD